MKLFCQQVLTNEGWQYEQTLDIVDGRIGSITAGKDSTAQVATGPVIPGMVNCHSHAFQRAFAGFSEQGSEGQDSFWTWRKVMYNFLGQLTPEQCQVIAQQLYIEMLKAGYTSVAEFHYLHHDQNGKRYDNLSEMSAHIFQAARHSGIALTHLPVLYRYAGFGEQQPSEGQRRFINDIDQFNQLVSDVHQLSKQQDNCRVGIAPHSLRATSKALLQQSVAHLHALDNQAPVHIHIAEQQLEVQDSINHSGKRPIEWLLDNLDIDRRWCLIHATHLTAQERQRMAASGAVAGICPTTEANLGDGIFPTCEYLNESGALAIGSDSHISVNPVEELRWLEYSQRMIKQQRALLADSREPSVGSYLWQLAARGGAQSIGRECGEISVGKKADLVVLDQTQMALYASDTQHLMDSFIFANRSHGVKDVMVGGNWVIQDGQHLAQEQSEQAFASLLKQLANHL